MTFSKYPLCNEKRVAWEDTYGFITNGADQMTPKGFCQLAKYISEKSAGTVARKCLNLN